MTLPPFDTYEIEVGPPEWAPYELRPECAHPLCNRLGVDPHEIARRSKVIGIRWWLIFDGLKIGNRVTLCRDHHREVTGDVGGYKARIWWDDEAKQFLWLELQRPASFQEKAAWEALGELDPHPPILEESEGDSEPRANAPAQGLANTRREAAPSSECLHPSLAPGQKCPGCTYRKPHPRKVSSPATKQFGFHVPAQDVDDFAEVEDAVFAHLGLKQDGRALPHARHKAVLTGYSLILQAEPGERVA